MNTNKRLALVATYILVSILSLIGVLFCSVQPEKSFHFLNPSQFFGILSIVVSLMNAFYLFFSKKEEVSLWISCLSLSTICFGVLHLFLTFALAFPIFDFSNSAWGSFLTEDALYLSVFVPLLLLLAFVFTPQKPHNIFFFSIFGLSFVLFYMAIALIYFGTTKDLSGFLAPFQRILKPSFFDDSFFGVCYFFYILICLCFSYGVALLLAFLISKINSKNTKSTAKTNTFYSNSEDL